MQRVEVLAGDESGFVLVAPGDGVPEKLRPHADVIGEVALPAPGEEGGVRHGAAPGEDVHEGGTAGEDADDLGGDALLGALVWYAVVYHATVAGRPRCCISSRKAS